MTLLVDIGYLFIRLPEWESVICLRFPGSAIVCSEVDSKA